MELAFLYLKVLILFITGGSAVAGFFAGYERVCRHDRNRNYRG